MKRKKGNEDEEEEEEEEAEEEEEEEAEEDAKNEEEEEEVAVNQQTVNEEPRSPKTERSARPEAANSAVLLSSWPGAFDAKQKATRRGHNAGGRGT